MARGRSKKYLEALRKKYGLGEFASKRDIKRETRRRRRQAKESKRYYAGERARALPMDPYPDFPGFR